MTKKFMFSALAALTTCASFALAPVASAENIVKIGGVGPFTGPVAQSGIDVRAGMELAAKEWNEQGGIEIDGVPHKIVLAFEDDASNPVQAMNAGTKLLTNDNVDILVGDLYGSSPTHAIMELADEYKKPILSCQAIDSEISKKIQDNPEKYKYFWKGMFSAEAYAEALYGVYKYIEESGFTPENKTLAFIVEDTDYGRTNIKLDTEVFAKDGWTTVAQETVPLGATNFNTILGKIESRNPDILITVFTSTDSGIAVAKQFNELGLDMLHFATYYPLRDEYIKGAGDIVDGIIWTPEFFNAAYSEKDRELNEKMQAEFNRPANGDVSTGYDCLLLAATAIKDANSKDADKIVEAMGDVTVDGILGKYVFNKENHTTLHGNDYVPIPVDQIQNGKNVPIWPESVAAGKYQPQPWLSK